MARKKLVRLTLTQDEADALLHLAGEAEQVATFEDEHGDVIDHMYDAGQSAQEKLRAALHAAEH